MKTHNLNLTFKTEQESNQWVEQNCPNMTYNGECILMINRSSNAFDDEVTIVSIYTI